MNILEARRRVLGGEVYKKTAEGNPVSVRSLARMCPGLSIMGKSTQKTTTGAQLFNFSNAMQKIIYDWGLTNILSAPDTNDISIQWENLSGQAQSYIAIVCPFSFENGKTIYITRGASQRFLVYDNNGQNIANKTGKTYTPNEGFDGYVGIGIDIGKDFNSPLVITYDKNFSTAEPYTGGQPSPNPDYPQEITSAGDDGSIEVSVSDGAGQNQFLTVQTPNGLPGIPVNSGGNYTDENGQQWICDEIDFKRGKYVQRIHVVNAKNRSWDDAWNLVFPDETGKTHVFDVATEEYAVSQQHAMSNVFFNRDITNSANVNVFTTRQGNGGIGVRVYSQLASTLEEWNAYINSHDVIFVLALKKQGYVETPLSPSELAAYAALRTYSPTTVVSNDAGAWMKLGYKTKKSLEVTD